MHPILDFLANEERAAAGAELGVAGGDEEKPVLSDVRLKTDIDRVGATVMGLPLYHFRYRDGEQRYEGVMAQDVLKVAPDAVITGEDGYYRVDYRKLGIQMRGV